MTDQPIGAACSNRISMGKTDDARPPASVIGRIIERQVYRCATCWQEAFEWHADHKRPLWDGGENRESNLQALCVKCHRLKTAGEAKERAQARRKRNVHRRIKKRAGRFKGWRKFNGEIVWAK